jgi:hypothetical protein
VASTTLDPAEKKRVQEDFQNWMEVQDRRKELTAENKEIIENSAAILNVSSSDVNKVFKVLKQRYEDGDDKNELETLYHIVEEVSA